MRYYDANRIAIRDTGNGIKNNDINASPLELSNDMKNKIRAKKSEKNKIENN